MHASIRLLETCNLRQPLMVAAFASRPDETAAATVQYLVEAWHARPVAEVDPDEFFDFTVRRPVVRLDGERRTIEWASNTVFAATLPEANQDVLLFLGTEPSLRWRNFSEVVVELLDYFGASGLITLRTQPGNVPHTRPRPIQLLAREGAFAASFGIQPTAGAYEGPADIATVVEAQASETSIQTASLNAMTPFYLNAGVDPRAAVALVKVLDQKIGTSTPIADLLEHAHALEAQMTAVAYQQPHLAKSIASLEQQFDWLTGTGGAPSAIEQPPVLPSAEEVLADVERLLNQQRGGPAREQSADAR